MIAENDAQDTNAEVRAAVAAIMAARPVFKVGDRVRILARPECRYCREWHDAEVGHLGTVDSIGHSAPAFGEDDEYWSHPIWVEFDEPIYGRETLSHFAPTELELLSRARASTDGQEA